jgi:hypothetical protein
MRILILTIALLTLTAPAFADCFIHQAAKPDTVATTTTTTETPAPAPASGG